MIYHVLSREKKFCFLFGLFFLGLILIHAVFRASSFNSDFLLVGLGMVIIPGGIFFLALKQSTDVAEKDIADRIKTLKKNGEKISVVLFDCEIISNAWTQERRRYVDKNIPMWNSIGGDADKNVVKTSTNISVIKCKLPLNGRTKTFKSGIIAKDKVTLQMLLELQGTTFIYVDKKNPKQYYFDLEFLK